jgi:hypothetical protein
MKSKLHRIFGKHFSNVLCTRFSASFNKDGSFDSRGVYEAPLRRACTGESANQVLSP